MSWRLRSQYKSQNNTNNTQPGYMVYIFYEIWIVDVDIGTWNIDTYRNTDRKSFAMYILFFFCQTILIIMLCDSNEKWDMGRYC